MMKRAFTLLEVLLLLVILLIAAAVLFPVFYRPGPPEGRRSRCQTNLKQIGLGFLQYIQDYNERFPPTHPTPAMGWADVIYPYLKSQQIFQCPSASNTSQTFTSDYFYNNRLSRLSQEAINEVAFTILSGDGDDNAPTWSSLTQLPTDAATNSGSPAQRHEGYANYLFADGHVKTLAPGKVFITVPKSAVTTPRFAPR